MIEENETKEELISEILEMKRRISELEGSEHEHRRTEEALRESEDKFRVLTEKSLVGVYLIQDGVLKYVNPRLAEMFGYTKQEMIGKKVEDMVFPEDRPKVNENIRKRIAGEVNFVHYELRGLTKNQEMIDAEVYGSRILYQGRPAVMGTLLDVTERKRATEAITASEEKYRIVVEQSNDMIWTLDREGNFTFFNKRSEEISGYRLEDWMGKTFAPLIVEEDLPRAIEAFNKSLQGEVQHYEVHAIKKDGDIFALSVNTAPILEAAKWLAQSVLDGTSQNSRRPRKIFGAP